MNPCFRQKYPRIATAPRPQQSLLRPPDQWLKERTHTNSPALLAYSVSQAALRRLRARCICPKQVPRIDNFRYCQSEQNIFSLVCPSHQPSLAETLTREHSGSRLFRLALFRISMHSLEQVGVLDSPVPVARRSEGKQGRAPTSTATTLVLWLSSSARINFSPSGLTALFIFSSTTTSPQNIELAPGSRHRHKQLGDKYSVKNSAAL